MNANRIVETLPDGYRWADEVECNRHAHPAYFSRMVQVKRGSLGAVGSPNHTVFTSLAIRA